MPTSLKVITLYGVTFNTGILQFLIRCLYPNVYNAISALWPLVLCEPVQGQQWKLLTFADIHTVLGVGLVHKHMYD